MQIIVGSTKAAAGRLAAEAAATVLQDAIRARGTARLVVATGASQFEFLAALTARDDVDWSKVEAFHLDEYVGMSEEHPASFRRYLRERFVSRVPLKSWHPLEGDRHPEEVISTVGAALQRAPVDLACVGIGENAHLAFNDPPADFEAEAPYLIVTLDEACRRQQVGEGWFRSIDEVPARAISMSIRQIMRARTIVCVAPEARKAQAVRASLEGPVTPAVPASMLQQHADLRVFLDSASAALMTHAPAPRA